VNAYEIQVYQNGKWEFDSYFDDRDLVISEAERLDGAGRYSGVRVVEEIYSEETNKSETRVIFSRLKKAPARRAASPPLTVGAARGDPEVQPRYTGPRSAPAKRKGAHPMLLIAVALGIVLLGIGAIIVIRQLAGVA
jgi:hypothetical protein